MQYTINRSPYATENRVLTTNLLKIIAAISMVLDHVGFYLVPEEQFYLQLLLRGLGRLAFPIFAYCIAEGCRYTSNRKKRFWVIFTMGVGCELFITTYNIINTWGKDIFVLFKEDFFSTLGVIRTTCVEGNIFLTFSCSILLIYIMQEIKKAITRKNWKNTALLGLLFAVAAVCVYGFHRFLNGLSYGVIGICLPLLVSVTDYKKDEAPEFLRRFDHPVVKLLMFAIGLVVLAARSTMSVVQTFGLLSLIPLALYNGKPGSKKMKWWFYVFYPAHLLIIWLIGLLIR